MSAPAPSWRVAPGRPGAAPRCSMVWPWKPIAATSRLAMPSRARNRFTASDCAMVSASSASAKLAGSGPSNPQRAASRMAGGSSAWVPGG